MGNEICCIGGGKWVDGKGVGYLVWGGGGGLMNKRFTPKI